MVLHPFTPKFDIKDDFLVIATSVVTKSEKRFWELMDDLPRDVTFDKTSRRQLWNGTRDLVYRNTRFDHSVTGGGGSLN